MPCVTELKAQVENVAPEGSNWKSEAFMIWQRKREGKGKANGSNGLDLFFFLATLHFLLGSCMIGTNYIDEVDEILQLYDQITRIESFCAILKTNQQGWKV